MLPNLRAVMETTKGLIYCAHCILNGKKYIGQTKQSLRRRINRHFRDSKYYNSKFQNALNKYGKTGFLWGIIEECGIGLLNDREIYWIDYYDTYYSGYNSTFGGDGGFVTHCNKYRLISPWGELFEGENISKFAREQNLDRRDVSSIVNGYVKSYKGWKLPETEFIGTQAKIKAKEKEFKLISPEGELVIGKNRADFCRKYGLSAGNLSMLINKKPYFKSVKGWKLAT